VIGIGIGIGIGIASLPHIRAGLPAFDFSAVDEPGIGLCHVISFRFRSGELRTQRGHRSEPVVTYPGADPSGAYRISMSWPGRLGK
jgi:hypothetical protein